jgi:N-acetylmuramoyl-L-alanine amidase
MTAFVITRRQLCFLLGLFSFLLGWNVAITKTLPVYLSAPSAGTKVIIDPGHGGGDPGVVGSGGLAEKNVALAVALALGAALEEKGVEVCYTRRDDRNLADPDGSPMERRRQDLIRRGAFARSQGGDIFISIHAGGGPEPVWSGAQTFYLPNDDQGRGLAILIQNELLNRLGPNHRQARAGSFQILRDVGMPAVLIEVGFLSNPREERLLGDADHQGKLAEAIGSGVIRFFGERQLEDKRDGDALSKEPTMGPSLEPGDGQVLLYFQGGTNREDGLVAEMRDVGPYPADTLNLARLVLDELIKGPVAGILLRTLPRGTKVKGLSIHQGVCHVDFSQELAGNHWGGGRSEELTIYSVVNTLCELPGIKGVRLSIEGDSQATIGGHILLGDVLTKNGALLAAEGGTMK